MQTRKPDVLVVGAGPVGLVAAIDLARRGVAVRIIDKMPEPTDESRAVVLHARSLELLDQLGVLDEITATGVTTTGAQLHANGSVLGRVGFDAIDSPFPFSIPSPRPTPSASCGIALVHSASRSSAA